VTVKPIDWIAAAVLAVLIASPVAAQTPAAPPAAQDDDPDRDINLAQPDFTLAALHTTLRVPRHKSSFRVTHRFGRPLGSGDFGDLASDLFGLDGGAQIGLEYRFGHRTSNRTIQFFAERELIRQGDFPITIAAIASAEGTNNFRDSYSPALGVILSREIGDRAALYFEPVWVNNTNDLPSEVVDDNDTVLAGLGARVRIRPTVYLFLEAAPKLTGYNEGASHVSFGIEKRAGGHLFQLNFSNNVGTTFAQVARAGTTHEDWFLGFNISRKFF
jgi:uncharacterized beta barrel domain-containing protein DUF5777